MDIADLDAVLHAIHRVLCPEGWFVFVIRNVSGSLAVFFVPIAYRPMPDQWRESPTRP